MALVLIAIGSNLNDKFRNIAQSILLINKLRLLKNIQIASYFLSKPALPEKCNSNWYLEFLNTAILGETILPPYLLLYNLQYIEKIINNSSSRLKFAPRLVDLDIILYEEYIVKESTLTIPHNQMIYRDFVLYPMENLIPQYYYHDFNNIRYYKKSLSELCCSLKKKYITKWCRM